MKSPMRDRKSISCLMDMSSVILNNYETLTSSELSCPISLAANHNFGYGAGHDGDSRTVVILVGSGRTCKQRNATYNNTHMIVLFLATLSACLLESVVSPVNSQPTKNGWPVSGSTMNGVSHTSLQR